ncbi:MAG TPA: hypothetical protein VJP79_03850 [Nitrososphaera sp.]|nr:hypothetical protein [Nitrososphaera sp.]
MPNGRTAKADAMSERKIGETGIFYPEWFWEQSYRFADILILVRKGKTEQVAKEIYAKLNTCIMTSWRVNSVANLVAQVYYQDSLELRDIIETIHSSDFVEKVEFSEYVQIVNRRDYRQVEKEIANRAGA